MYLDFFLFVLFTFYLSEFFLLCVNQNRLTSNRFLVTSCSTDAKTMNNIDISSFKTPFDLSIGYQNIAGIHEKTLGCKIDLLKFIHDIEILSETWGPCSHSNEIAGYKIVNVTKPQKQTKKGRDSGGILIYCKDHIKNFISIKKSTPHFVWLELSASIFYGVTEPVKLCIIYNPPDTSKYCNKNLFDDIGVELMKYTTETSRIMLIGDLNARTGVLPDMLTSDITGLNFHPQRKTLSKQRENCDNEVNPQGLKLIDFCKSFDIQILNGRTNSDPWGSFTHYNINKGASTIDYALASDSLSDEIKSFNVMPQNEYSDHCKIIVRVKNVLVKTIDNTTTYNWHCAPPAFKWDTNTHKSFKTALMSPEIQTLVDQCTQYLEAGLINPSGEKLQDIFIKTAELCIKTANTKICKKSQNIHTKVKTKRKWYDSECQAKKHDARKCSLLKQRNPNNENLREKHKEALKNYKNVCANKKRGFLNNQVEEILKTEGNPDAFWDKWKEIGDEIITRKLPENLDGFQWENYFKTLYDSSSGEVTTPEQQASPERNRLEVPFTMAELEGVIHNLKSKKSAGIDRIKNEFLKSSPQSILQLVLDTMNLQLKLGLVPKSWCVGVITPIHKEGPKTDPDNYRGICVGNTLLKILCTMINNRILAVANENNLISKEQIGFKKQSRASDHIFTLKSLANKYVTDKNGGKLYACFIDLRKAYDTINHDALFYKLRQQNINDNLLKLLNNIYRKSDCAVKINGALTNFFPCKKGLRQGDPLSPLLFNLFINDIFNEIDKVNKHKVSLDDTFCFSTLAYADDIVLFSTTKEGLQSSMNAVGDYCQKWKLNINYKKTKCMRFTKGNQREKHIFKINNIDIENVSEFKYLGITIGHNSCNFNPTINDLSNKANRALYMLNSKIRLIHLPIHTALKLFDILILPILLYASEVWQPYLNLSDEKWEKTKIEQLHTQFIKRLLGLNRSTTNILARGEVNRHTLQTQILNRNITYIKYIRAKDNSELVKQAYDFDSQRDEGRAQITSSITKFIDPNINIFDIPTRPSKYIVKQICAERWKEKLRNCPKGATYQTFKDNIQFEKYLTCVRNRKHRVALTKLRTSDHNLMIEVGRRKRPRLSREERTCSLCKTIEDEKHFLLICPLYPQRDNLIRKAEEACPEFKNLPTTESKLIYLLSQENEELLILMAELVHNWLTIRENLS